MKRFRLIIILVLVLISTTLSYLAWSENAFLLDFVDMQNSIKRQELKNEITRISDIDSLRKKSLLLAEVLENRNREKEEIVIKVQQILFVTFLTGIIIAVLLIIEFRRRRKTVE